MASTAILSALAQEQEGLRARLANPQRITRGGREFWRGSLYGEPVVLALSRIGKVAAATTATALIESFGVERIVFTGVAGALDDQVAVGDVVVARQFVQHDMNASPLFPRYEVPLYGQSRFDCDAALTSLLIDACRQTLADMRAREQQPTGATPASVHCGLIASGDLFVATADAGVTLKSALQAHGLTPLAVEMEGAAVAQVCHDYGIAFAAARSISDRADSEAKTDFVLFIRQVASQYALGMVDHLMRALARRA